MAARPTILGTDGKLYASSEARAPTTLARMILLSGPLDERSLVKRILTLSAYAAVLSVIALFGVGAATSIFTGRHAGRAGLRMALIGAVVAAITFGIGTLVGQAV